MARIRRHNTKDRDWCLKAEGPFSIPSIIYNNRLSHCVTKTHGLCPGPDPEWGNLSHKSDRSTQRLPVRVLYQIHWICSAFWVIGDFWHRLSWGSNEADIKILLSWEIWLYCWKNMVEVKFLLKPAVMTTNPWTILWRDSNRKCGDWPFIFNITCKLITWLSIDFRRTTSSSWRSLAFH